MPDNIDEAKDGGVCEGRGERLLRAFADLAAKEARLVQFGAAPDEWLRTEQVKELLEGDDRSTSEGLLLLDRCYRYRLCGYLRYRHPELSRDDLVSVWQRVLLAIVRQARRGGIETETLSADVAWTIADRCAERIQIRRSGWITRLEQALRGTDLGGMWQMLSDLQQEEVLSLISRTVGRLPRLQRIVWDRYAQSLVEGPVGSPIELNAADLGQSPGINVEQAIEEALSRGRERVSAQLKARGYDLLGDESEPTTDDLSTQLDRQTSDPQFALDRLVAESLRGKRSPKAQEPIDISGADRYLTAADHEALNASDPDLPQTILFQHRTFPRPETALCSRRHATIDTRLQATTTRYQPSPPDLAELEAARNYAEIVRGKYLDWAPHYDFVALLGVGGQGTVYMVRCPGSDGYENLLALKIFDPRHCVGHYVEEVRNMARMARLVSSIHHPNVLDVIDFRRQRGVRMMLMELINGYDLGRLMVSAMLERIRLRATREDWDYLSDVVVNEGRDRPLLRPGVAVAILRHCLAALDEMHRRGIVHGDIKPWNIMLANNGYAKLIDIGSAFPWREADTPSHWTPLYLAPEVMEYRPYTPSSDLASLGYVLIELMSGCSLFAHLKTHEELLEAKKALPDRLADRDGSLLPSGVMEDSVLLDLCRRLIDPDPKHRFPNASDADLNRECGAYRYLENLTSRKLSVAWEVEIRRWLAYLG